MRERLLAGALLAASLWIAIKFEATRTTTPDANLMSRISGGWRSRAARAAVHCRPAGPNYRRA